MSSYLGPKYLPRTSVKNELLVNHLNELREIALQEKIGKTNYAAEFTAVILSGFNTGNNSGTGIDPNDARIVYDAETETNYLEITVAIDFLQLGGFKVDVTKAKTYEEINQGISLMSTLTRARSQFSYESLKNVPLSFGHQVICYYENGNQNKLRFKVTEGTVQRKEYLSLYQIEGSKGTRALFEENAFLRRLLGPEQDLEGGVTTNVKSNRPTSDIKYVVVHYSGVGRKAKTILNYENKSTPYGYHYMIDLDGTYINTAKDTEVVSHCGNGNLGTGVKNKNSMAIMLVNDGYIRKGLPSSRFTVKGPYPHSIPDDALSATEAEPLWEPYTLEAVATAVDITANICNQYGLDPDTAIFSHDEVSSTKNDIGPAFDMQDFKNRVRAKLIQMPPKT